MSLAAAPALQRPSAEDALHQGRAFLRSGHTEEAITVLEGAVAAAPGSAPAKVLLAKAFEAAGRKHRARLLWLEIAREAKDGHDGHHLWRMGRSAAARGDDVEAEARLCAYLDVAPGDLAAAELLLEVRLRLGQTPAERRATLDQHASAWPETAFSVVVAAAEAHRSDSLLAATAALERAEGMWSSSLPAALRIAELHEAMGNAPAAIVMLDRAIALFPHESALWRARLRIGPAAGHAKAVLIEAAEKLASLQPDRAGPQVVRARLHAQFKEWAAAAACWQRALDLDKSVLDHWRGLLTALGNLERNAAVEALLEQARQWYRTRGPDGMVELAVLETTCGWHERAAALAAGAMANPRTRARARAVAAEALLRGGQYTRAWGYLSTAVQDGTASAETLRLAARCAAALRLPAPGSGVPLFPDTLFERALLHAPPVPRHPPGHAHLLVTSSLGSGGAERQVALTAAGVTQALAGSGLGHAVLVGQDLNPDRGRAMMRPVAETPGLLIEDLGPRDATAAFRAMAAADPALRPALELMAALPAAISRDVVKLFDCFRRHRPRVVHLWQDGVITAGSIAAVFAGVPRIVCSMRNVVAGEGDRRRYRRYLKVMYRALAQRADVHFTANSAVGAADYERWLDLPAGRIQVLRNGLEVDVVRARAPAAARLAAREELGLSPEHLLVGGTFRLAPAKRPHLWIAVAEQVAARVPHARFVIVGDGALRAELEALIDSRGLTGRVMLAGRRSPVEPWIAAMDAMLLASEVEGLPNVLLEAQAMGVPVVTTNAGGSAEAVLDGVTGVLAPDDSAATLAAAVERVLRDEAMRARARVGAPAFIEQRFGLERMIADTLAAYDIVKPGPGDAP